MEQDLFEAKCVLISLWNNCPDRTVITLQSHYQLAGFLSKQLSNDMIHYVALYSTKHNTVLGGIQGKHYITELHR